MNGSARSVHVTFAGKEGGEGRSCSYVRGAQRLLNCTSLIYIYLYLVFSLSRPKVAFNFKRGWGNTEDGSLSLLENFSLSSWFITLRLLCLWSCLNFE